MKTYYHVTLTKYIESIICGGIRAGASPRNWKMRNGSNVGGDAVYAFESKFDALRWAAMMEWETFGRYNTGKVAVLVFTASTVIWEEDHSDPLSHLGSCGKWLKTVDHIPSSAVTFAYLLTPNVYKKLVNRNNAVTSRKAS